MNQKSQTTKRCGIDHIKLQNIKSNNRNNPKSISGSPRDDGSPCNITFRRSNPSPTTESNEILSLQNVRDLIQEAMDGLLDRIDRRITKIIEAKTKEIFKEINSVKESINYLNAQYEDMQKELHQKSKEIEKITNENGTLRAIVKDLGTRLSIIEQQSRMCNLEIQCIPEHKTENLTNVILQIGKVSGYELQEGDIHKCTRIAKMNPENKRPRSVVVKFSNPRVRDTFMANVMKFNKKNRDNKLNTSHIGIGGEKKSIYVVDHLTPETKKIHAKTREWAKKLQYKYVWVKNGRVFLRKTETSEHIMIRDLTQLESLS
ncbi:unnamed protein product [Euphydryas editha]|uniref:FP protein C-terminal domain-containing protein n=1 Tax=Euphydryas editha TaxID=104508 RepID=A0AAU9UF17_EUPED|nr:unnamed protein product [Euphydryas editha]